MDLLLHIFKPLSILFLRVVTQMVLIPLYFLSIMDESVVKSVLSGSRKSDDTA
jgi:hypothetical protein